MGIKKTMLKSGYFVYYVFLIAGALVLLLTEKGDFLLWLNEHHNSSLDIFFKYWTHLGDGLIFAVFILIFLMTNYYRAILLALATITQTLVIQGMKRLIFDDSVRPKLFFENFENLYSIPGVDVHTANSFPSGHTATAFTIAVILALMMKKNTLTALLMMMAILVGISRVYLLQHFFVDIYFGSLIGFLNGAIVFFVLESSRWNDKSSLKKGLVWK